jgi:alkaline phosphatase D
MPLFNRRQFVASAAALGMAAAHGGVRARPRAAPWTERRELFPQGVASGDPNSDSVILWTRRPPIDGNSAQELTVEVSERPDFRRIAARGRVGLGAATDWTCRFLAGGLKPAHEYFFRFVDEQGQGSRVGRTLTAPDDQDGRPVRFAFVSCQDPTQGALNAWRRMIFDDEARTSEERLGFVLHLGDFIYELVFYPEDSPGGLSRGRRLRDLIRYANGRKMGAFHLPSTLDDYRTAYRAYLTDPDLQDARARWPFVCMWDNHEFSWQGFQSQEMFGGEIKPGQTRKVFANQAWWEYQPARVRQANGYDLDRFDAPKVSDAPLETFDEMGLGLEPNNLAALGSLTVYRALRWGRHVDLILTDNRSYASGPYDPGPIVPEGYRGMIPQEAYEIVDSGRAYGGGNPPATIRYGGKDLPNTRRQGSPDQHLGAVQKAWFLDRLKGSSATWKIWGHSFGTLLSRADLQNLPSGIVSEPWPVDDYGVIQGGYFAQQAEICGLVREQKITGFAIVAGDRHAFWAGLVADSLPPKIFDPVGVEFVTGSISAQGTFEVVSLTMKKEEPLRALWLHDRPDGTMEPALNMTVRHGVQASLELQRSHDVARSLALSNASLAPHLKFADLGSHGFATVRATADTLETEFVCIPIPFERIDRPDGGPLLYRIVNRVPLWKSGEAPRIEQELLEGTAPLGNPI